MSRQFTEDEQAEIRKAVADQAKYMRLRITVWFDMRGAWFSMTDGNRTCSSGIYPAELDRAPSYFTARFCTILRLEQMWKG